MKKKGFTLIELLAVILILGIIALIAVPQVNNIINEAKEKAVKVSVTNYINAINDRIQLANLKGENILTIGKQEYTIDEISAMDIKMNGDLPDSGTITIENNEVTSCNLHMDNYNVTYNGEELVINKQLGDKVSPQLVVDNNHNGVADINDKVCIDTECFYVISNDGTNVRMLSEWNLNVGYDLSYNGSDLIPYDIDLGWGYDSTYKAYIYTNLTYTKLNPSVVKQDSTKRGYVYDEANNQYQFKGIVSFAPLTQEFYNNDFYGGYWVDSDYNLLPKYGNKSWDEIWDSEDCPYVYDSNSNIYPYINSYVETLKSMTGNTNITGNLITYDELASLGCVANSNYCIDAPSYVNQTSYWSGAAYWSGRAARYDLVWSVYSDGDFYNGPFNFAGYFGVRPVIEISTSSIN